jgi:hypothetical protein
MGQQQLLLIVLSVIIVGIAIVVGINMFGAAATSANLEAVSNDLMNLGARAQQYYVKPASMAGGGNSFVGIALDDMAKVAVGTAYYGNENGGYKIKTAGTATALVLTARGKRGVVDSCEVEATVTKDGIDIAVVKR